MLDQGNSDCWDFTPVIDLVYALSTRHDHHVKPAGSQDEQPLTTTTILSHITDSGNQDDQILKLGNFDKIWTYLGQPLDIPAPAITETSSSDSSYDVKRECSKEKAGEKGVRWQDEIDESGLKDTTSQITLKQTADDLELAKLQGKVRKTKKGKTESRKQRKDSPRKVSKASKATKPTQLESSSDISETEVDNTTKEVVRRSNLRRSVIEQLLHDHNAKKAPFVQSRYNPRSSTKDRSGELATVGATKPALPVLIPSSISVAQKTLLTIDYVALAAVKKQKLLSKLYDNFINERQYLKNVSLIQHDRSGVESMRDGIHVFVDVSNILIGFHDALKLARGIPISSRITRQPLSFHNLSLILERGRPAAKRVLVGSDNFESIQEAKLIGYETNILDRVHKAKELTARQKNYQRGTGQSSGSETNANVVYGPEKWVEQAVDEILHLKILESVVDATEPSTMVLASGDGAEAEYSDGFLKMVERALSKGWKVELVSFSKNTSWAYKKKEFRARWGQNFTIIELDDYVEELLDDGVSGLQTLSSPAVSNVLLSKSI